MNLRLTGGYFAAEAVSTEHNPQMMHLNNKIIEVSSKNAKNTVKATMIIENVPVVKVNARAIIEERRVPKIPARRQVPCRQRHEDKMGL